MLPVPYFTTLVLTWALPTVSKLFIMELSMMPPLVVDSNRDVLVMAVRGAVGGVKAEVYTADLTQRTSAI